MFSSIRIIILFCCLWGSASLWAASSIEEWFFQGNEAYQQDDFPNAIKWYQHALHYGESVALHFNLANAYFKNNQIGQAIYHYERALLMEPQNPEVKANLSFVRSAANLYPKEKTFMQLLSFLTPINKWVWIACISFWVLVYLLILPRFYKGYRPWLKTVLISSAIIFAIASLALMGYHQDRTRGFILDEETVLKVSSTANAPVITYLRSGQEVFFKKAYENYINVRLLDEREGWVSKTSFVPLWKAQ